MLPRICSPQPPHGAELCRKQSLYRVQPSPVHPHEGAPTLCCCKSYNFSIFEQKASFAPLWEHLF